MINNKIYRVLKYIGILLVFLAIFHSVSGQENDTDTIPVIDSLKKVHSPHKAVLMSTLVPGLGQIYNKKYWKVPIIYATFATVGYFIAYNNNYYLYFKGAYAYKLLEDGNLLKTTYKILLPNGKTLIYVVSKPSFAAKYPDISYLQAESLQSAMNTYRRWRDLNALGFIAFYALQVIDANVDAHFFNYDISRDLSINLRPAIVTNDNLLGYAVGLKINVHF